MGGKAALIFVLGFSFLMGYTIMNLNTAGTRAVGNMSSYNAMTASHNLALAGANVALAKFYRDTTWGSISTQSISQNVSSGNLAGSFTATVSKIANGKRILCVSSYPLGSKTYYDSVDVTLGTNFSKSFSLYAWMTNLENGVWWITGDSVWGRVHSNDDLSVDGSPVFLAKVTTAKGFIPGLGKTKSGHTNNAKFFNPPQPETGVARIDFPNDLTELATAGASVVNPKGKKYTTDIWVTLDGKTSTSGDGKAYVRTSKTGPIIDSINLADPNFNGVLLGTAKINVQGTLDGRLTIASYSTPGAGDNDIIIQDNVLYEKNPRYGTSDDMLGLVANNDVIVADNISGGVGRDIQASIFTRVGSFRSENYNSRSIDGELRVLGSIVQNIRGAVGTFNGGGLNHGFYKRYRYDDRLSDPNVRPPSYPGFVSRVYTVLNWWESYKIMDYQ